MRLLGAAWLAATLISSLSYLAGMTQAQDLSPRAYLITPNHSNAVNLTYSFLNGGIEFSGAAPITGASATINLALVSYYHSFSLFGRSANFAVAAPYGVGHFRGTVVGAETYAYRSGLLGPVLRFSVNLIGGPSMNVQDFVKWRQKRLLGVSFQLVPLAGQYDPTKLINLGTNRWAFKSELGYSRRWGHWILDAYGGAWFFTTNPEFFSHNALYPGTNTQSENPVGSVEGHLSYEFKPRLWASLDGNFWFGGSTSLNGVPSPSTQQRNSRVGATAAIPLTRRQSVKVSYSNGAYIRYGGNYQSVSVGWQYAWVGRPK